jgi:integrase
MSPRCSAATLLLARGADQRVVTEILGHSQISMTSRYAHVLPQVVTDAAERIGRALRVSRQPPTATQIAARLATAIGQRTNCQVRWWG